MLRQLRASLVPEKLSQDEKNNLLNLKFRKAKEWMKKQANDWDREAWEQEGESRDEAFYKHPFTGVLEWVTVQTGISSDYLRKAALKHFNGSTDIVKELRTLDDRGQTADLWQTLVKECLSVLRQAGLMPEKPTDDQPSLPVTERGEGIAPKVSPTDPALGERAQLVLIVLRDNMAFDSDHRITTADIAAKAAGKEADPNQFKEVVAELKGKPFGYVDTKEGRGGGCWLTAAGQRRAEKL